MTSHDGDGGAVHTSTPYHDDDALSLVMLGRVARGS